MLATTSNVRLVKAMIFPVVMYGCESWTINKAELRRIDAFELWCWRWLLRVPWTARRSSQSILKEISPGCSIGRTDVEAETPILWPPHAKSWLVGKDPDTGKDWWQEKGTTEDEMAGWHHQLNGHEFAWTPGVGDGQGGLAYCVRFIGLQRVRRDWTELNWSQWFAKECLFEIQDCKLLATGQDFSQDYIAIGYCGMEGAIASFMIQRSWTIHQVPSFFFTGRIGVLHGKLVGTNSPQARKLF